MQEWQNPSSSEAPKWKQPILGFFHSINYYERLIDPAHLMRFYRTYLFIAMLIQPLLCWGIDLLPNDIVAPLPDKNYVKVGYYGTQNNTYFKNGSVVSSAPYASPVIENPNANLRLVRSYAIGDLPGISYIQLPYGTIKPQGSLSAYPGTTGFGDVGLASAIWPYSNRETRTYLGIAGYLILPTGSYSSTQTLTMGGNRYISDLQVGFQKPIIENLEGMIAVDTMFFGGNSQCATACLSATNVSLTQKPLTTVQLGPVYAINHTYTVGASYIYVAGGATLVNNAYQNNVINTQRFLLSGIAYTDLGRFTLQYGRDMEIKNGFIQTKLLSIGYTMEF